MAEPSLKLVAEAPGIAGRARAFARIPRRRLRAILLVAVPLVAAAVGLAIYLGGGRYITTDNAYVGAQKVLITPDISGKIARVLVREGQRVKAGDELFDIDPQPFRIALTQAEGKLAAVRTEFAILKSNLRSLGKMAELAQQTAEIKQRDLDRKQALIANRSGSQADLDNAAAALVAAHEQAQTATQRRDDALNQLQRNPDLPIEQYPAYMQARAALDQAQRDLDHAVLRAPIDGTATQVDNIQLGRFVTAGTPILAIIDDSHPWVDANPKETDITDLKIGQPVLVVVDTFPDYAFFGTVVAISPGTSAQFAIIPPQNASGNWVKVVQRVPLRIRLDPDPMASKLRAGMSAYVEIDTGRKRWLASLFGSSTAAKESTEASAKARK
ncbi:MAG: HlyD family secretion protein [Xanthobacteraceae bacterium]